MGSSSNTAIALFGGTFDPIHLGHLDLAKTALESLQFEKLFFVPARQNPLKTRRPGADADARWKMVNSALSEFGEPKFSALDWEIRAAGPSYTILTVERMAAQCSNPIALVMGNEVFTNILHWKEPRRLLEMVDCVVLTRAPQVHVEVLQILHSLGLKDAHWDGSTIAHSSSQKKVFPLPFSPLPYSATKIRDAIKKHWESNNVNETPRGIQRSVWQFIKKNRLYAVEHK